LRLEQFSKELHLQRERRERATLHEAALAKRKRRLDAVNEKLTELLQKRKGVIDECTRLEERLERMNFIFRLFRGPKLRRRLSGLLAGRATLEERIKESNELTEKIQGEPLPEPEGLSLESRRLINVAAIALAQHLVVHFAENDLASLAKTATQRPVADMKFGDRRACDHMVERIRARIEELRADKTLADQVKKRTDFLINEMKYRNETDSIPHPDCVGQIRVAFQLDAAGELLRRSSDAPLQVNVVENDFWDLYSIMS
jgi:hypothetical protein